MINKSSFIYLLKTHGIGGGRCCFLPSLDNPPSWPHGLSEHSSTGVKDGNDATLATTLQQGSDWLLTNMSVNNQLLEQSGSPRKKNNAPVLQFVQGCYLIACLIKQIKITYIASTVN